MPLRSDEWDRRRGPEAYLDTVLSIWAERRVTSTAVLTGDSMAPALRHGDRLVIQHGNEKLRIGDVIVYAHDGKTVAHRLVRRVRCPDGERRLLAKGDRSAFWDPAIHRDQVLGKVVAIRGPKGDRPLTSPRWIVANYVLAGCSRLRVVFARFRRAIPFVGLEQQHDAPEGDIR